MKLHMYVLLNQLCQSTKFHSDLNSSFEDISRQSWSKTRKTPKIATLTLNISTTGSDIEIRRRQKLEINWVYKTVKRHPNPYTGFCCSLCQKFGHRNFEPSYLRNGKAHNPEISTQYRYRKSLCAHQIWEGYLNSFIRKTTAKVPAREPPWMTSR